MRVSDITRLYPKTWQPPALLAVPLRLACDRRSGGGWRASWLPSKNHRSPRNLDIVLHIEALGQHDGEALIRGLLMQDPQCVEYVLPLLSRALLFMTIWPDWVSTAQPPVAAAGASAAPVEVAMISATAAPLPVIGSGGIPLRT